jgi:hypothetical protein
VAHRTDSRAGRECSTEYRCGPAECSTAGFSEAFGSALQLSDEQRAKIKRALSSEHTEVSFGLKSAKGAQNFEPSPGATIPKGLGLHPLPRPLVYDNPVLKRYTYLKFKHEVLIVNPMTRKIVDMFPET